MKANQPPKPVRSSALILSLTLLGALPAISTLGGCQLFNEKTTTAPGPRYPNTIPRGEVFDVQVFRQSTTLRLTNTTTRDFGPSTLWLNQRYSAPIDGFASAQTLELDLKVFVDEFGETYRAGGFFAQRVPAPVILCELETDEGNGKVLHGFVVVENAID